MAFGYNSTAHPRLAIRAADLSATSWGSWYKVYTSDDKSTPADIGAAATSHTHSYLPLSGGTVTGQIQKAASGTSWVNGRSAAAFRVSGTVGANSYVPGVSIKSQNGSWEIGTYTNNDLYFSYITDTNFNAGTNTTTSQVRIAASGSSFVGSLSGNASTASKLATARTISLTGSVTGSGSFDGSGNLSIATTTNHTHSYLPLSGGTCTGSITIKGGSIDVSASTVSSRQYGNSLLLKDKNGASVGYLQITRETDGKIRHEFGIQRTVSGSAKYNYIIAGIDNSGNFEYGVASPAAFRSAIGITSGTGNPASSGTAGSIYIKYA